MNKILNNILNERKNFERSLEESKKIVEKLHAENNNFAKNFSKQLAGATTMYEKQNTLATEVAKMIDDFLRSTGMTQSEFATGVGIGLATINKVLNLRQRSINHKTYFKIKTFITEHAK